MRRVAHSEAFATTGPNDYRYRVPLKNIQLLPKYVSLEKLIEMFPAWRWPAKPQGKVNVNRTHPEMAEKLWKLAVRR